MLCCRTATHLHELFAGVGNAFQFASLLRCLALQAIYCRCKGSMLGMDGLQLGAAYETWQHEALREFVFSMLQQSRNTPT
jgi:hypothetical protein